MAKKQTYEEVVAKIEELQKDMKEHKEGRDIPGFRYGAAVQEMMKLKRGLAQRKKGSDDR